MVDYDPIPDSIAALEQKSWPQRFAIARLLEVDDPSLEIYRWLIEQPDCDRTTAAIIFWRLRALEPGPNKVLLSDRASLLQRISERAQTDAYRDLAIAWDGSEAWERTPLIGVNPLPGVDSPEPPRTLFGPFIGTTPEPATYAFFESPYEEDDIFDSLWRYNAEYVAAADWLTGKSHDVWMSSVEQLIGGHPNRLYLWMASQPECPAPVAGQIFWEGTPVFYSQGMLERGLEKPTGTYANIYELLDPILQRWRQGDYVASDLDFRRFAHTAEYKALLARFPNRPDPLDIPADLLDPVPGRVPGAIDLADEFDFWCIKTSLGGLVPRPRSAAVQQWKESRKPSAGAQTTRSWSWRNLFR